MPEVTYNLELSAREFDAVLAALRLYARLKERASSDAGETIRDLKSAASWLSDVSWIERDRSDGMTAEEIDALGDRINGE